MVEVVGSIVLVEKDLQTLPLWVDALTLVVVGGEYQQRNCVSLGSGCSTGVVSVRVRKPLSTDDMMA